MYDKKPEGEDDKPSQPVISNKSGSESIRSQLGTFVCPLGKLRCMLLCNVAFVFVRKFIFNVYSVDTIQHSSKVVNSYSLEK